jgi:GTP cyclohydrolase IB
MTLNRTYDYDFVAGENYICTLPDLQNGPESLIKGAKALIPHVGIHNFKIPLKFKQKDSKDTIVLETSVTGSVSLEATKKGINMSRIMRTFYEYSDDEFTLDTFIEVLNSYKEKLGSFDAHIMAKISYPIRLPSLRSKNAGWQYYDVIFHTKLDKIGNISKAIELDFVYSSTCPCSYELSEHARETRNQAAVAHSQRSTGRIYVELEEGNHVWIEDLREWCNDALQTETQVMVKREDEQAFAELNAANTKFVEDAVRLIYAVLDEKQEIKDFRITCSHLESLHSHDAIACITKGINGGLEPVMDYYVFRTMVR